MQECIAENTEDARHGVSRPQIKKFVRYFHSLSVHSSDMCLRCLRYVEEKYKLEIGNAQTTQLSKAIARGEETGVFVLPKGKRLPPIPRSSSSHSDFYLPSS